MEYLEKILTKKQYNIYKLKLEGHTVLEIAKIVGCSHQNIYTIIANANKRVDAYKSLLDNGMTEDEAFSKMRKGSAKKPERKNNKIDYTIKDEYDLSLISDEYREILVRKNNGESFAEIARDFGCATPTVWLKAKSAICILNGRKTDISIYAKKRHDALKNNEEYAEKKREYSRKWYKNHLEEERNRSREKRNKHKDKDIKI